MSDEPQTTDFEYVEPHLVSVRFHGQLESEEVGRVFDRIEAAVTGKPFFLLEVIMTHISGVTPDARRVAAERLNLLPPRAIAVVGGSFAQRILAKLVLTASMMLQREKTEGSIFDDQESARAFLRAYAEKRQASGA